MHSRHLTLLITTQIQVELLMQTKKCIIIDVIVILYTRKAALMYSISRGIRIMKTFHSTK